MANEKIDTTQNIITPPTGDREKEKRLLEALKAIPDEEIIRLWDEFDEEERKRTEEEARKRTEEEARKRTEEEERRQEEEQKKEMALRELMEYRESWGEEIDLDDSAMDLITEAVEEIPLMIEVDSDGSRLIEFKLWDKIYKILDPKIKAHSDPEYFKNAEYSFIKERDEWVKLWWMMWDDVDDWENQKLKEYVEQKRREWFHIPTIEEIGKLLEELWDFAGLWDEDEQIAMLMYLTGIDWRYWLSMWGDLESGDDYSSRTILKCGDIERWFESSDDEADIASLLMISCKWDDESERERYVEEDDEDEFL